MTGSQGEPVGIVLRFLSFVLRVMSREKRKYSTHTHEGGGRGVGGKKKIIEERKKNM